MMTEKSWEGVKRKRERNEACLNCRNYVSCDYIAQYEDCEHFEEVEGEAWVITKLG